MAEVEGQRRVVVGGRRAWDACGTQCGAAERAPCKQASGASRAEGGALLIVGGRPARNRQKQGKENSRTKGVRAVDSPAHLRHRLRSAALLGPMQGQMAAQNGRPANMRPGDWMCPSCNNHNYADKVRCNRCKMPKPDTFDPFAMRQAKLRPLRSWG